jgi:hypothetical protein
VEETTGACKKARLFAIVGVICCNAAESAHQNEKMFDWLALVGAGWRWFAQAQTYRPAWVCLVTILVKLRHTKPPLL